MIAFHFNQDLEILEVSYEGTIHPEEIITYSNFIKEHKGFPRELRVIIDAREANYQFSIKTVQSITSILKESMENYTYMKVAMLHSKPVETAYSLLIENRQNPRNYIHKIFTTKEAALIWLQ